MSVPVPSVPALAVRDLTVRYGRAGKTPPAVDDVSFDVVPGETLGLVGESGSGKSTIGKAILGLQPATAGQVLLHGTDITRASLRRRRVAAIDLRVVFQDPYSSLNPDQTIGQTLTEPLRVLRVPKDERSSRVAGSLTAVGLPADAAGRYPARFSGGQRQRIAIARALVCDPTVLICDEVTSALDVSVQAAIVELLGSLQRDLGLSMLFITHNLPLVRSIAQRVAVLSKGSIVELGDTAQVLTDPQQPYTRQLLSDTPSLETASSEAGVGEPPADVAGA